LRARVIVLVTTLSLFGFIAISAAGWLIVLRAEDEMLDAFLLPILPDLTATTPAPVWVRRFADAEALQSATGISRLPAAPGWYEGFKDPADGRAVVVTRFADRWRVWRDGAMEDEFRLRVPADASTAEFILVDITAFEFTEARTAAIRGSVLALAGVVVALALALGLLIARWTLRPVVVLAGRVHASPGGAGGLPLAAGFADDEIGFLAGTLDAARRREADALAREHRFLAECSHELRTPLATLRSALALWPEVATDPSARARIIGRMERAVTRAEAVVRFFLVLAREDRQRAEAHWVDLAPVVRELVEEFTQLTPAPGPNWQIAIPASARVWASRDVVVCVVRNLIDNAIKHTPRGTIMVRWADPATFTVADDGPGFGASAPPPPAGRPSAPPVAPESYGLGWLLLERLCRIQNWILTRGISPLGGARVDVAFDLPPATIGRTPADARPLA
jgi:signal transduction histidine kinase